MPVMTQPPLPKHIERSLLVFIRRRELLPRFSLMQVDPRNSRADEEGGGVDQGELCRSFGRHQASGFGRPCRLSSSLSPRVSLRAPLIFSASRASRQLQAMVLLPKIWAADGFLASASDLAEETRPISAPRRPPERLFTTPTPTPSQPIHALHPARPASSHPAAIGKTLMTPSSSLGNLSSGDFLFGRDTPAAGGSRPSTSASGAHPLQRQPTGLRRQQTMGLSRPPWSVKDHAPAWWEPRPKDLEAIGSFDRRHHGHHARANRMTREVARDSTSLSKSQALGVAIWELGHNRYFLVEALEEARRYEKRVKPRKKKVWKLVDSIWSARRKAGDAKDFYDTPHVKQSAFYCDWNLGVERMKLDKKAERAAKVGLGADAVATARPSCGRAWKSTRTSSARCSTFTATRRATTSSR